MQVTSSSLRGALNCIYLNFPSRLLVSGVSLTGQISLTLHSTYDILKIYSQRPSLTTQMVSLNYHNCNSDILKATVFIY